MRKDKIDTLLVFCLSFTVVFGGWFLTKGLLHCKENEMLTAKGRIVLDNTKADGEENNPAMQEDFVPQVLSEDQMAEILTVWEAGGREILHEPMAGQMNMEQAIEAGEKWITSLADNYVLSADFIEYSFRDTSAVLCSLDSFASLEESWISYWKITYTGDDVKIVLKLHAATGQVWKADISVNEDKMLYGICSDEEVLAAAFPFLSAANAEIIIEDNKVYKVSENEKISAALKRDSVVVDKQTPVERLLLSLGTNM